MSRTISRLGLTTLALIAGGTMLVAQQATGGIKGRVTEGNTGKGKAGVTVTLRNYGTNAVRETKTDADGAYRFVALPVGRYKVTFKSGDRTFSNDATANLGVDNDVMFKFPTEAMATVVVEGQSTFQPVNGDTASTGVNVTADVLGDLPVASRSVIQAAVMAPGVQLVSGSNVDPTKKASTYISNGEGQGRGTNFNVDGGDNNSTDVGGYVSSIPLDAIQEFQVVTNQYKAEFGRSNAGFLNVVTKSGTNDFGGIVNFQYTDESLRARRTDEITKAKTSESHLSATVTGPIVKDKLFYMISAEQLGAKDTPAVFSALALTTFPALGGIKVDQKATTVYSKLDWLLSSSWSLAFNFGYDKNVTENQAFPHTGLVAGRIDPGMLGNSTNKTIRYGTKLTGSFGSVVWESLLGYFDYANGIVPHPGLGNGTGLEVRQPFEPSTKRGRTGADPNAYQNTGIKRTQWRNDLTWVTGDHVVKAGLDWQHSQYVDQKLFFPETGLYIINVDLPYGLQPWQSSVVADTSVIGALLVANGFQSGQKFDMYGVYLQDDWTVSPKLSVYLGLRADKDTVFDFIGKYAPIWKQISAASAPGFLTPAPPENKTYVSPRIQAVYKPFADDSLTFRFGVGRFVANTIDNVVGFSRALGNKANGIPNGGDLANLQVAGPGGWYSNTSIMSLSAGPVFYEDGITPFLINGHQLNFPTSVTPYNYVNNVGGLRDYFRNTVNSWLTAASYDTAGKNLIDGNFRYPTTDSLNLAFTLKWNERHALDTNFLYSRTKNATTYYATDGSGPLAKSVGPGGADMGDNVFRSNQTARSKQLQIKYSYTRPRLNFLFNLVAKDNTSTYGGSVGAFDNGGQADFYGQTATPQYATGPERRSAGTENLLGSSAFSYRFEAGTLISALATWHSGKAYDVNLGYATDDRGNPTGTTYGPTVYGTGTPDIYHPIPIVGYKTGDWSMDLSLRIAHQFKFGRKMTFEPFLQANNLLNNYDYGANYDGTLFVTHGSTAPTKNSNFGNRGTGYQTNSPRSASFGAKFTF